MFIIFCRRTCIQLISKVIQSIVEIGHGRHSPIGFVDHVVESFVRKIEDFGLVQRDGDFFSLRYFLYAILSSSKV